MTGWQWAAAVAGGWVLAQPVGWFVLVRVIRRAGR